MPRRLDFIQRANAAYIEQQYERFRQDPASVPEEWALFFAGFDLAGSRPGTGAAASGPDVVGLIQHYRQFGHVAARIDPLAEAAEVPPALDASRFGFEEADLDSRVSAAPFGDGWDGSLRELIAALAETYCGSIGVEYMGITEQARREWLQDRIEPRRNHAELAAEERIQILRRLLLADGFEEFLNVRYPGQKRFSLEGAACLIPMLDELIERAASHGAEQLIIGMPHRGRLNVLVHVMNKPYEAVFSEFESSFLPESVQGHGDVKYHMGYSSQHETKDGRSIHLDLNFNPSHLEFVNPVVLGAVRARQDMMKDWARSGGVPVLIHGDAAFSGEGIVPETLALAQLPAYDTGGTVHIVVNNQIGFTTSPGDARVSRYATDVARVEDAPVFHVNGDDPEAAVHAIRLAVEYRAAFKRDAFVDLVCYRRHGHNELDDPTFTQPVMYRKIAKHVPAARNYAQRLIQQGVLTVDTLRSIEEQVAARLREAHARARAEASTNGPAPLGGAWTGMEWAGEDWNANTAVPLETLRHVVRASATLPEGFRAHRKLGPLLEERVRMVEEDRIDWGCGEALAFGSLLLEGRHVRLSGQDTGRGTFSHRHSVLHDAEDGRRWVPLQHLAESQGDFTVIDTLLSEAAVLGFEYGYSTSDPHTLTVWEAQFGDFANVAQVYIDQFLASAEAKWRRMSGLTLLLPHGYEGQGPEHSSARLERFLELCANGNMQVCTPTTPAQLFHALRRQLHRRFRKPLVILSPKSLLRHKLAISAARDFTSGGFRNVIDDASAGNAREIRRVLLTSGKFFYTLLEARGDAARGTALVRLEQLYPFPHQELEAVLARYPEALDVRWVQEEPANMGAWRNLRHRIEAVLPAGASLELVARKASSTPATGYYQMHVEQERELIEGALSEGARGAAPALRHGKAGA